MKTAREHIMHANEGDTFYNVICNLTEDQIIDAMKEYAEQVAREALKDAAENAKKHTFAPIEKFILNTEIKTP